MDDREMLERRAKRSRDPVEALQYLVEALCDRSEARAVAIIDARGRIVAGIGAPSELRDLASLGGDARAAQAHPRFDAVTRGTDYFACAVRGGGAPMWIVALGERLKRFTDAALGAQRIVAAVA
jgi:hypothetical protein